MCDNGIKSAIIIIIIIIIISNEIGDNHLSDQ